MFDLELYDYKLPPELIAQDPIPERDQSRLLVLRRGPGILEDHRFYELPELLSPSDLLVLNDTKVVPARLFGRKQSGGRVEMLVLFDDVDQRTSSHTRWCLLKVSKPPRVGMEIEVDSGVTARVLDVGEGGLVKLEFQGVDSIASLLEEKGEMPLPPYIKRAPGERRVQDFERYQTIYSRHRGAVAAPTAGLHFTQRVFEKLDRLGIKRAYVTLHVSYGTFQPVRVKDIRRHKLAPEYYSIPRETAEAIEACKNRGGRVVGVGTTVVRTLEGAAVKRGYVAPGEGSTGLLITPGFKFQVIDAMITNFHLPKSSLLFLVAAFAGLRLTKKAYEHAVRERYRFYSYGDAMLIL